MGVKLSQARLVGLFNPVGLFTSVGHLLRLSIPVGLWRCLSGIVVRSSVYDAVTFSIPYMHIKLMGLWEPLASLCVTNLFCKSTPISYPLLRGFVGLG